MLKFLFFIFSSISNLEVPIEPLIPANPEVPLEESVNHQPANVINQAEALNETDCFPKLCLDVTSEDDNDTIQQIIQNLEVQPSNQQSVSDFR